MMDVAQRAGVSPMTVSRAFKDGTSVSAKTREKVTAAADELGYVFDSTASNLRSQKTNFVAVTIPSINNANFAQTVRGLSDALRPRGLQVLLGYTDYDMAEEERLVEQLLTRRPEAIVVTGGSHTPRARRLLQNAGIPVVETWDLPKDPIENVVGFSNAAAVERLVDHLVEEGKTRIAFIGGDATRDTRGADRRPRPARSRNSSARCRPTARLSARGGAPRPPGRSADRRRPTAHFNARGRGRDGASSGHEARYRSGYLRLRSLGVRSPHRMPAAGHRSANGHEHCRLRRL